MRRSSINPPNRYSPTLPLQFLFVEGISYAMSPRMSAIDQRRALERLIQDRHEDYAGLSRLIGRNAAYIQQFIKRGTPRKLDEEDRKTLARYFGVDESVLGGPPAA